MTTVSAAGVISKQMVLSVSFRCIGVISKVMVRVTSEILVYIVTDWLATLAILDLKKMQIICDRNCFR